jgi:hypothetical protein
MELRGPERPPVGAEALHDVLSGWLEPRLRPEADRSEARATH